MILLIFELKKCFKIGQKCCERSELLLSGTLAKFIKFVGETKMYRLVQVSAGWCRLVQLSTGCAKISTGTAKISTG